MRSRWMTSRALGYTALMLLWVAGCLLAGWWQATRALDGNALSYVYSVEWPVFAIAGTFGWWALIHTTPATAEQKAERQKLEQERRNQAQAAKRRPDEEDADLRAYNDHLADLAGIDQHANDDRSPS